MYDLPYERNQEFWGLWRDGGKESLKKLGFGITKEQDSWIIYWDIKFKDILLETIGEKEAL
jgi:hypothetical protein